MVELHPTNTTLSPTTIGADICVGRVIWVTARTMHNERLRSPIVLGEGHQFHVIRVDASLVQAEMVDV
jgi:hypothetical protein